MRPWVTNAILFVVGGALLGFTRQLIVEFHHYSIGFSGVAGWSVVLYLVSALVVWFLPLNRFSLLIVIAFGIAFRLVTLFPEPHMSSDIYRYAWDGVVQHAHISPYRYVPGDAALFFLRNRHGDLFEHINRRNYAHTIYPPVAQMIFYCVTWFGTSVTSMKLAMILFEGITVYALMKFLEILGRRREEVLLYLWCPLLIWEIGSSGHVDSAAMAFMSLALLARLRLQPVKTGLFLGAAILIKFYPLVLIPALWQRRDLKMPATIAMLATASYACYASVGKLVFGFLGGYVHEEGMETGTRYFLLEAAQHIPGLRGTPVSLYLVLVMVSFALLAIWSWRMANAQASYDTKMATIWLRYFALPERAAFLPGALLLALALMLAFSPHYPWYLAWLVPFAVLLPNLAVFTYTLGLFYLATTPLGAGTAAAQYHLNCVLYSMVLIAAVADAVMRKGWSRHVGASKIT